MVRVDFPNKPGDYSVDGISIIILPEKVIVDTGDRYRERKQDQRAYTPQEKKEKKEKPKEKDALNSLLDNCQDIVMGKKRL